MGRLLQGTPDSRLDHTKPTHPESARTAESKCEEWSKASMEKVGPKHHKVKPRAENAKLTRLSHPLIVKTLVAEGP